MLLITLMVTSLGITKGQDANCDYSQEVDPRNKYYVYSPNYSNYYTPGVQCRWLATSPPGYNSQIVCSDIDLPQSTSCSLDQLLISKSGDPQLTGADTYCGKGTLTLKSNGQTLSIGLKTSKRSPGGRFYCELTAVPASSTPSNCTCGYKKRNRIVGGVETQVNEFPMMAGLVDLRDETRIYCGATIIHNKYLVTAAHCLIKVDLNNLAVVLGEHDISTADSTSRVYKVADTLSHPRFNKNNYDYDVALLLTERRFEYTDQIGPACLPFKFQGRDLTGAKVTALGWGTQFPGGPDSNVLMKVDLDVISQSSCRAKVSNLTDRQLCTLTPGKDACQDDSGGPLLLMDQPTGALFHMGIISYGRFCASNDDPGISTRVTEILEWILANTQDAANEYCRK